MKCVFVILSLFISSQAFARRNYFEEYCFLETSRAKVTLQKHFYWNGAHMNMLSAIPGLDKFQSVYLPTEEGGDNDPASADDVIVFKDVIDHSHEKEDYDDGCWKGFNARVEREAVVESIDPQISSIMGLKAGDKLEFKCEYESLIMSGDRCDLDTEHDQPMHRIF